MKQTFFGTSQISGFRKWSLAHRPEENDNDPAGGGRPFAIRVPAAGQPAEQPHRAWVIQGVGNAL
jgi:hypothetical protein